jgi:hypothetical protein
LAEKRIPPNIEGYAAMKLYHLALPLRFIGKNDEEFKRKKKIFKKFF